MNSLNASPSSRPGSSSIPLDQKERARVLSRALVGVITNAEAAGLLRLSVRQVRRLKSILARKGPAGLVHGNRGRPSPRRLPDNIRARLVELATTSYAGYSHGRICQLLAEREQLTVTRSTLRRVLLEAGVQAPRRRPRLPPGAMPIGFDLGQRRVQFLDLHGADYHEPVFQQTVDRWRRERPAALTFELELAEFEAVARTEPGRPPDGFIFSVGRPGSTLIATMLSLVEEHLVIKESPAVNALVSGLLHAADDVRPAREALLQLAVPFMFRPTRGTEQRLLFALSSWNLALGRTLLRLFPTTPAVFVYRPGAAAVASLLAKPPGWRKWLERPRASQARYFPSLASLTGQERPSAATFYAHAWRSAAAAALSLPPDRLLLVEHDDLLANPKRTLPRVLTHLGVEAAPFTLDSMCRMARTYQEDPTDRSPLGPVQQAEVDTIIGDLSRRLEERRRSAYPHDGGHGYTAP